jgi:hypothetical protein
MQDSIRREAKIHNKLTCDHKRKEMDVRDFNKNLILTRQKNNSKFQNYDNFAYGARKSSHGPILNRDDEFDPILEAGERRYNGGLTLERRKWRKLLRNFSKTKRSRRHSI